MSDLLKNLPKVRGVYRENAELKNWFDVGGKAEIMFRPADISDLQDFLKNCPKNIPINILGAASNVIVRDEGVKGVVIRLGGEFAKVSCEGEFIKAGAATLCGNVALFSKNEALTDFEFLSGIPGSIGGAIAMNGGCYGSDMSQILVSAKALDFEGNLHEIKNLDFGFFYRGNKISKNFIFVEALLKGQKSTVEVVSAKISELNQQREKAQPIRAKTGGSTFKNPEGDKKAWQLIDEAGCRGMTNGDAQVSEKHCNFLINQKHASANDLIDLGNKVKKLVKEKSGVDLKWEIKILG
ncbi:MAG: UDP-N-acetylmuramate dehydrogenase [Rickettsiales bacterium]|nr:UDP-N-acetylmuramate dehydrogenase [Rickettsiales bacterium]